MNKEINYNHKLPPFKWFCLTNFPFIEADFDALTYYELLCKVVQYLNEVIVKTNAIGEQTEELTNAFNELKNYVDTYFDNLDVQKEINNKLDAMVEDGTLAEIINQQIFDELNEKVNTLMPLAQESKAKTHFINVGVNNGNASAIEIENNNILVDLGSPDGFNALVNYLITNNLTTFKYVAITHWDIDHANSPENFISLLENQYFNFSNCQFIFPHHNINWSRTVGNEGQQLREETIKSYLLAHNYTIIYPNEEDTITLDVNNYLKFYNLKASFFENYYTETDDAGNPQDYTNYNNFSMVIELNTCYKSILFTGDINYLAEDNIASEIKKIDAIQLPHHGLNRYSNQEFIRKCFESIGIISSNASVSLMRPLQKIIANTGTLINLTINGNTVLDIFDNKLIYNTANHTTISPNVKVIETNTDLNDLLLDGTYILNNENLTITNGAPGYTNQFMLDVKAITQTIVYQFMYTFNSDPIIWCRKNAPAGWTPWRLINIKEYGILIATMSSSYTITSTANEKLPFDTLKTNLIYGNAITFDATNHQIKVGKGVNFIRVDLKLIMSNTQPNDRLSFCILKNNNVYQRKDTYAVVGANESFDVSSIVQVTENDIVTVSARNISSARGSVDNANYLTTMQVEII